MNFRKICAHWVPEQLTAEQRNSSIALSLSHLKRYHKEEYSFLSKSVTILNPKASVRASSRNVRLHHLQKNQRSKAVRTISGKIMMPFFTITAYRVSGMGNHHQYLALSSHVTEP
ncbi:uncharacterized protein TNCV_940411 [Trichonephila clavipes]|nr:uncharacterized protein TNCV_940411 [Trichonephila clavipes]